MLNDVYFDSTYSGLLIWNIVPVRPLLRSFSSEELGNSFNRYRKIWNYSTDYISSLLVGFFSWLEKQ